MVGGHSDIWPVMSWPSYEIRSNVAKSICARFVAPAFARALSSCLSRRPSGVISKLRQWAAASWTRLRERLAAAERWSAANNLMAPRRRAALPKARDVSDFHSLAPAPASSVHTGLVVPLSKSGHKHGRTCSPPPPAPALRQSAANSSPYRAMFGLGPCGCQVQHAHTSRPNV